MVEEDFAPLLAVPVLVLDLLLCVDGIVGGDLALQVARELLDGDLEVGLVVLEYDRVVVALEIEGERVRVHERLAAQAEHLDGLLEKLHLDPGHVVLLHLLHLLPDRVDELLLELQALMMVHVAVAVVQVALERVARLVLVVARLLGVVLVEAVAVVPGGAVRLPRAQAHPAELAATRLILAYHVIAAAVLLDGDVTLGTLFGVGRYPVGRLRVVVALLDPLLEPLALDRIVPLLTAAEAEDVRAVGLDRLGVEVVHLDGVWRRTLAHQPIALRKLLVIKC